MRRRLTSEGQSMRFDRTVAMRIGDDAPGQRQFADLLDLLIVLGVEHIDRVGAPACHQQLRTIRREAEVPATLSDRYVGDMLVAVPVENLDRFVATRRKQESLAVRPQRYSVRPELRIDGLDDLERTRIDHHELA